MPAWLGDAAAVAVAATFASECSVSEVEPVASSAVGMVDPIVWLPSAFMSANEGSGSAVALELAPELDVPEAFALGDAEGDADGLAVGVAAAVGAEVAVAAVPAPVPDGDEVEVALGVAATPAVVAEAGSAVAALALAARPRPPVASTVSAAPRIAVERMNEVMGLPERP